MNALINDKVQQVIITFGRESIYLFSQTRKSGYVEHVDASKHSFQELIDAIVKSKYQLVDAQVFCDPSMTGNCRLMFYSNEHAPKKNISGAATIFMIIRGIAGKKWKVRMAFTPYHGSRPEDGHKVLNIHLMPTQRPLLAGFGLRITEGWNRLNGRFA